MKKEYYKLPLDFDRFFNGDGQFERCTEQESVDQFIELILTTPPGKHRFNPDFGCKIWDLDFQAVSSVEQWTRLFKEYVTEAVSRHEKRLGDILTDIDLQDVVREDRLSYTVRIRKRADIYISAMLKSTGEPLRLKYTIYLSPLSNE